MSFPPFSNERVLIHGLWQKSRGRQPCQPAHNQRNPQLAFAAARGYLDARSIIEAFREKYRLQWMYAHATEF